MTLAKVVRKASYQGVPQWGISTSSEITPSRKTAQKWAELENAHNKLNCAKSIARIKNAVQTYRSRAYEPVTLREFIALFGEVYSVHFVREFCLCKDGMVRVRRLSTFGKWVDTYEQ